MFFRFLRQILRDEEFERTKVQLAESKVLLAEYKETLQKGQDKPKEEKVDPDFLTLLWASIGFATAVFIDSAKTLTDLKYSQVPVNFTVWMVIALASFVFMVLNTLFALELTNKYALEKANKGYSTYAILLIGGIIILTISTFVIAFWGAK